MRMKKFSSSLAIPSWMGLSLQIPCRTDSNRTGIHLVEDCESHRTQQAKQYRRIPQYQE
jgi:hypothetical protein